MATSLAATLRQQIERRSLTMAEAAEQMGVTQPTVSRWLRGTPPDAGRVRALAGFLEISERRVEELVMQARRDQLEQRRSEIRQGAENESLGPAASEAAGGIDFNSAMTHVPDHVRQTIIELVTPYLDEDERPS